jgi:pimeloyl-ACP methyl ester carboxylesterase
VRAGTEHHVAKRGGMTPAAASTAALLALAPGSGVQGTGKDRDGRVRSADDVEIVYSARGAGETALVFIHGGLADREFWAPQLSALADAFRVVALDLGGHGSSGRNRKARTIAAFGEDARAVVEALALKRVVLIGNSLGGPVALEAAGLLRGRVLGVMRSTLFTTPRRPSIPPSPGSERQRFASISRERAGPWSVRSSTMGCSKSCTRGRSGGCAPCRQPSSRT